MKLKQVIAPAIIASVAFGTFASASAAGSEKGSEKSAPHKIEMCHVGNDGAAKLINVSANASFGHAQHGDNIPGGEISGQEGYIYGDDCAPVSTELAAGCYDSLFFFDLQFNGNNRSNGNSNFVTSNDGSCSGNDFTPMTLVQASDQNSALASCDATGAPTNAAMSLSMYGFQEMPDTAWLCQ